jgi:hypothetical protein
MKRRCGANVTALPEGRLLRCESGTPDDVYLR